MARITRKELKKDEFAEEISKTYQFLQAQRERLTVAAAVLGIALLAGGGGYLLREKREAVGNEDLGRALRTYHAPVRSENASEQEREKTFATDKERYTEALKEFRAIAGKYSWLDIGKIAHYYAGLCQDQLGNPAEAEKEFGVAVRRGDTDLAAVARLALANLQARTGKGPEAEKNYRYLVEHPSAGVPRAGAQLALADYLSPSKPAEAQKLYQDVKTKYPATVAAELADQGLAQLKTAVAP